jgi:hypothetical protein
MRASKTVVAVVFMNTDENENGPEVLVFMNTASKESIRKHFVLLRCSISFAFIGQDTLEVGDLHGFEEEAAAAVFFPAVITVKSSRVQKQSEERKRSQQWPSFPAFESTVCSPSTGRHK